MVTTVFDLGWDVPAGQRFESAQWMLGSLIVADDKFPSCSGTSTLNVELHSRIRNIYGQDLAGDSAIDITKMIELKPGQIVIPGEVIEKIGLSAATDGDLSEPGMVLKFIMQHP